MLQWMVCVLVFKVVAGELVFPPDFKFGVATASYQIEGGWNASGKGENIWDRLTHSQPERIKDHQTGDVACDSYHLWKDDVERLKFLGVHFYRFSLSWSRILPSGFDNYINPDGVRYYNDLINALVQNGIEPMVTLYHWDLPQPLFEIGGWPNPLLADHFENYARMVFELFGDRVKTWITFNEPPEICTASYGSGTDAPGYFSSGMGDYICGKTVLLAHARAYHLYNDVFREKQKGKIGITIDSLWGEPKTNSTEDLKAAERFMQMRAGWWMQPIFSHAGNYPQMMIDLVQEHSKAENFSSSRLPSLNDSEIKYILGTYDFLGLNHYTTRLITNKRYIPNQKFSYAKDIEALAVLDPTWKSSAATWLKVVPWGLRKLLNWIKKEYNNPLIYITENGFADLGQLNDSDRINYHKEYLKAVYDAINVDGCNVEAYTIWSLLDNMEWRDGYTLKFGLFRVNFEDPKRTRTPKASAIFYRNLITYQNEIQAAAVMTMK